MGQQTDEKMRLLGEIEAAADIALDRLRPGLGARLGQLGTADLYALERAFKLAYQAGYEAAEARCFAKHG
jgi:hypothetical protein